AEQPSDSSKLASNRLLLGSKTSCTWRILGNASRVETPSNRLLLAEEARGRFDRAVDFLVAVRGREEHRFVLRRRYVDAALQEVAEQGRVVVDEQRRHRADSLEAAVSAQRVKTLPLALELVVDLRGQAAQDREA